MSTARETDYRSRMTPSERFERLARPSWQDYLDRAQREVRSGNDRRSDGRRRQFNVTIADRAQLDALAETMGVPRSAVINLALAKLAEAQGERSDWYGRLCERTCRQMYHTLCERSFEPDVASRFAADVWRGWFPTRQSALQHERKGATRKHIEQKVAEKCRRFCTPTACHEQNPESWDNYWQRLARAYKRDGHSHWQW